MEKVYAGVVESFNNGWGFIKYHSDKGWEKKMFVHWKQIEMDGFKKLIPGQKVDFTIGEGLNGKQRAEHVQVVR